MAPEPVDFRRALELGFWKHGRFYGHSTPAKYLWPIDREEMNRMDLMHKFTEVCRDYPYYEHGYQLPTKPEKPPRVMDLGTGSGIWAIGCAEQEPGADVLGVDINRIQPQMIPKNMSIVHFDIEKLDWQPLYKDCDLIHMRYMLGSISDDKWDGIYKRVFEHLSPGGRFEHVEIDWKPRWNPQREGEDHPSSWALGRWYDIFSTAMAKYQKSVKVDEKEIEERLIAAGFVNIEHEARACDAAMYRGRPGTYDCRKAQWLNIAIDRGLEALSMWPCIEKENMTTDGVHELWKEVRSELCTVQTRVFMHLHTWTAQRPLTEE